MKYYVKFETYDDALEYPTEDARDTYISMMTTLDPTVKYETFELDESLEND